MRNERVLIAMKSYIGDAVMASPMLELLERDFSDITIQTAPAIEELLQDPIGSRKFVRYSSSRAPWSVVAEAIRLRRMRFDIAIVVNRSFRAALNCALAGIRHRIGHEGEGRRMLLTRHVAFDPVAFQAESCMDLARTLGCVGNIYPRLTVTSAEKADGRRQLNGCVVGVQPGARYAMKRLPEDVCLGMLKAFQERGHKVALLGGREEVEHSSRLNARLREPVADLTGKCTLRQSLGILASLSLFVCADTGLMHMAVAAGCPTLAVFGPTESRKWGHWYPPHQVVEAEGGVMANVRVADLLDHAKAILNYR